MGVIPIVAWTHFEILLEPHGELEGVLIAERRCDLLERFAGVADQVFSHRHALMDAVLDRG